MIYFSRLTKHNPPVQIERSLTSQSCSLENVPLAFIFLGIAELNGGNKKTLNYMMAALLALRVAHADGGLRLQGKFGGLGVWKAAWLLWYQWNFAWT